MNDNVKISFIPQKPLARGEAVLRGHPKFGLSFVISLTILTLTLGGAIGQAVYIHLKEKEKSEIRQVLSEYNAELDKNDTLAQIDELRQFESRIKYVQSVLSDHVSTSEIFAFLERTTPKTISFYGYSLKDGADGVELSMKGRASSYDAIAYLSQIYASSTDMVQDSVFSNLYLGQGGEVMFNVVWNINAESLLYTNMLESMREENEESEENTTDGDELLISGSDNGQ